MDETPIDRTGRPPRLPYISCYTRFIGKNSKQGGSNIMDEPGTYVVQDRNNQDEQQRLIIQDRQVTEAMGGVLPEQQEPSQFRRVLDIGCGPGGWLLEVAQTYPQIEKLYGIDISPTIIRHARQQSEQHNIMTGPKERVEFLTMDALSYLEFPHDFFDLINFRFGISFMRQWDWPKLFNEMNRVLKTGGIVRIIEGEIGLKSSSESLTAFYRLLITAFYRSGHLFKEAPTGLVDELPSLFVRHGFNKFEVRKREVAYRRGTKIGEGCIENQMLMFRTLRPFLYRYGCLPDTYEAICQQATEDMRQPDFVATGHLYTMWATNPKETNGFGEIFP
jgi:ubiquinone/menaquinone biosynthesis C-methylase UbiE